MNNDLEELKAMRDRLIAETKQGDNNRADVSDLVNPGGTGITEIIEIEEIRTAEKEMETTEQPEKPKVKTLGGLNNPAFRAKRLVGIRRNGYIDALLLALFASIGGGTILYIILSSI